MLLVTIIILTGILFVWAGIKKENPLTIVQGVLNPK